MTRRAARPAVVARGRPSLTRLAVLWLRLRHRRGRQRPCTCFVCTEPYAARPRP